MKSMRLEPSDWMVQQVVIEKQRTLMQLLAELDGFDELEHVKIIAATNRQTFWMTHYFDQVGLIRLSKYLFQRKIQEAMLELHLSSMNTKNVRLPAIAKATSGFSGAELKATCVEAGMIAIRSDRDGLLRMSFKQLNA